jgi:Holliday junction resolvasome RuvABC endonuclease subunit
MRLPRQACGNVLALDLASTTGFALGPFGARLARHGAFTLRQPEHVLRVAALREWMIDAESMHGRFSAVVVEAAIVGGFSSQEAARLTLALHSMVELWCYDEQIPFLPCAASTVRKAMLGRGSFPKGQAKPAVIEWCHAQGLAPRTDDAADAILLWRAVEAASLA